MESSPESAHGTSLAEAAAAAAESARALAALSSGPGDQPAGAGARTVYEQGRARELAALAQGLEGLEGEAPALAARLAVAGGDDRARLTTRCLDLAFEILEGAAAVVRLCAVSAAIDGPDADPDRATRRHAAALGSRSALELAIAVLRELADGMAADDELRLRLRVADAIREEVDALLGETRPLDPFGSAAGGAAD